MDLSWLKLKSNIKISSLEDIYKQSKNRYSLTLTNENIKLDFGDFYPYFNSYILNGSRVRGLNFHSKYKIFLKKHYLLLSIDLIKGELQRATQGDPYNNSIYISEVDTTNNIVTINRDNYTFKRELTALKLGIGFNEKILSETSISLTLNISFILSNHSPLSFGPR